jgi:iron complex outermembrane receptor protein
MKSKSMILRALMMGAAPAAVLAFSAPAMAQDAPTEQEVSVIEDVVVTARRRSESLQDVPIAVTAVTGESMEARGFSSLTDIQQMTPNLTFTPGTGGSSGQMSAYVRGVGEYDYIVTTDPAVAVFFDGVYQGRPFGALTSLMGIERVEVLRGPQGSLFGKNTIGGAISVVLQKPTGSNSGEVDLKVGSYDYAQVRGQYDMALTDDLSMSVSALGRWGDGWQELDSGGTKGDTDQIAGRTSLRYTKGEFDAVLTVDGYRQRQNAAPNNMIAFQPGFFSDLYSTFVEPCCTVQPDISRTDVTPVLNIDNADAGSTTLVMDFPAFGGDMKSISAARYSRVAFARDGDASVTNYSGDRQDITSRQFSQEFQLSHDLYDGKVTTLAGLYAYHERARQKTLLVTAWGLYPKLLEAGFDQAMAEALDFNVNFDQTQETNNLALFGNATIRMNERLSFDVGARLTYEEKEFEQTAQRIFAQVPLIPGVPGYELDESWTNFSPKVSVNYEFSDEVRGYAIVSQGFRSGGFNGRPTSVEGIGSFDPEILTSYELGLKNDLLDRRLRLNLSAFYNQYEDMQVNVSFPVLGGVVVRTENAGKARIWGIEAEGRYIANDWLSFEGAVGYLDAAYEEYTSRDANGTLLDYSGLDLKHTPPWTASLGAVITGRLGQFDTTFRLDAAYMDEQYSDTQNQPLLKGEAHTLINSSLNFAADNGLSFGIEGQNLTDEQVIKEGYDGAGSFGFIEAYYNPPRRIFATVKYAF